ncbi:MAG: tetratricopeptide repeat protein [Rhodoferax sp.]|nr:tetratricopeptide repeat protein [Rhodoferax sp.]
MNAAPAGPSAQEIELSIPELVGFAMQLHRDRSFDAAEKCYRAALQAEPDNANATHFLGVLMQQRGHGAEALALIRQSIALDGAVAPWHNNLGNVLLGEGRFDDAAAAYARCSDLDPSNREVLNNLGVLLRRLQRPLEAEVMLRRAIALDPDFTDAYTNLASLCSLLDRDDEAFVYFAKAVALTPHDAYARRLLVRAYGKTGRFEEGRKVLQKWLEADPGDPQALHLLAAYGGAEVPDRASDAYVEDEFDGFANSFDAKLAALNYRAPEYIGEAVAGLLGAPQAHERVLDVGCGTGLCGAYLRPYARSLVGVDLSANMLELARARGGYDQLHKSELVSFLEHTAEQQDLVVSADTLVYFGRLDVVFAGVKKVLRAGGHWIFTLEAHTDAANFSLRAHGRYSHARAYAAVELERAGFNTIDMREVVLRCESGEPVAGWLVSACAQDTVQ